MAMRKLGLKQVVLIPSGRPPHKPAGVVSPARDRLLMTRLAFRGMRNVEVSQIEIKRGGISYTIDTVKAMRRRFPGRELFFIVGADTARHIPTWKRYRELLRLVKFAVMARPGCRLRAIRGYEGRFVLCRARGLPLSSNSLRRTLARGIIPARSIPQSVARHIRARGLYRKGRRA